MPTDTNNATVAGFLNPNVHLNHFSPSDAWQLEFVRNIFMMILGATVWDILVYIPIDFQIVRRSRFSFVILCFIFARLIALAYMVVATIARVMPVHDIEATIRTAACMSMLTTITSSFLFLRRVQAVYSDEKWIQRLFSFLFFILSASEISVPLLVNAKTNPGTGDYKDDGISPLAAICVFALFLFDTSVLLAISYKITTTFSVLPGQNSTRVSLYTFISGGALPRLSRAILKGGQQYYLLTVGVTILVGIAICLPSISQIIKPIFPTMLVPLMASLACRVFRDIKLLDTTIAIGDSLILNQIQGV